MRHLKRHEFADLLDGQLAAPRAAHVGECNRCRAELDRLLDAWQRASAIEVPEPSPLFWDHFASRVQKAVEGTTPQSTGNASWVFRPAAAWTASALLASVVLALTFGRALTPGTVPSGTSTDATSTELAATEGAQSPRTFASSPQIEHDVEADSAWALVRIVADEVAWNDEQASQLGAAPGTAERLALELSEMERIELARLLEHELRRSGA